MLPQTSAQTVHTQRLRTHHYTQVEAVAFNSDDSQCAICCSNKIMVVPIRPPSSTNASPYKSREACARLHVVAPRSRVATSATSSATADRVLLRDRVAGDEAGWRAITFVDGQV